MVEQQSPKLRVVGSNPTTPAKNFKLGKNNFLIFYSLNTYIIPLKMIKFNGINI